jgi:hypothetical protein
MLILPTRFEVITTVWLAFLSGYGLLARPSDLAWLQIAALRWCLGTPEVGEKARTNRLFFCKGFWSVLKPQCFFFSVHLPNIDLNGNAALQTMATAFLYGTATTLDLCYAVVAGGRRVLCSAMCAPWKLARQYDDWRRLVAGVAADS